MGSTTLLKTLLVVVLVIVKMIWGENMTNLPNNSRADTDDQLTSTYPTDSGRNQTALVDSWYSPFTVSMVIVGVLLVVCVAIGGLIYYYFQHYSHQRNSSKWIFGVRRNSAKWSNLGRLWTGMGNREENGTDGSSEGQSNRSKEADAEIRLTSVLKSVQCDRAEGGWGSSSELDGNFYQVSDYAYFGGWATLPYPKRFRRSTGDETTKKDEDETNIIEADTFGTTKDFERIRFASFKRPSHLKRSERIPAGAGVESVESPKDFVNPIAGLKVTPSQSPEKNHSVAFESDRELESQQLPLESQSLPGDEKISQFRLELPDQLALGSTGKTAAASEIELFESFKQEMSAKGIIIHD